MEAARRRTRQNDPGRAPRPGGSMSLARPTLARPWRRFVRTASVALICSLALAQAPLLTSPAAAQTASPTGTPVPGQPTVTPVPGQPTGTPAPGQPGPGQGPAPCPTNEPGVPCQPPQPPAAPCPTA